MNIYIVTTKYQEGENVPTLVEMEVLKETEKTYVVKQVPLVHRQRFEKDDREIGTTPAEAWRKYIAKAEQLLAISQRHAKGYADNLVIARAELLMVA
jgi:hypothetical protein